MPLRFADCVLDLETREIWRAGQPVALPPQAFRLLELLVRHRPRPLRHEALRDALWPDTHVAHTALARVVSELREALGDSASRETLVRTVPRFGYAFVAAAVSDDAPARGAEWLLVAEREEFLLPQGDTLVGRGLECAVRLASPQVSRVHARVRVQGDTVTLEDRGSKNGTWVNGVRLEQPAPVTEQDEVRFGVYAIAFRRSRSDDSTRSAVVS